jgi:hypothetical protein
MLVVDSALEETSGPQGQRLRVSRFGAPDFFEHFVNLEKAGFVEEFDASFNGLGFCAHRRRRENSS